MSVFLWVALDGLSREESTTLKIAESLALVQQGNFGFKVNLDYLLFRGLANAVANVAAFGRPIFADLKMWNGSRTMADVVEMLAQYKIRYLNVYALADTMLSKIVERVRGTSTEILGVTVLTHYDETYCQYHFGRSLPETVRHLTETALHAGCHGVILPGTTLKAVRDFSCKKMVPGIRPAWFSDDRHKEEVTPAQAVNGGATDIVCGSPIVTAYDASGALLRVLGEMNQ